jgi:hypothetical protein
MQEHRQANTHITLSKNMARLAAKLHQAIALFLQTKSAGQSMPAAQQQLPASSTSKPNRCRAYPLSTLVLQALLSHV